MYNTVTHKYKSHNSEGNTRVGAAGSTNTFNLQYGCGIQSFYSLYENPFLKLQRDSNLGDLYSQNFVP